MVSRKHNIILSSLLLVLVLVGCGQKEAYRLVWEDNFEGTALNAAYWNVEDNGRGGGGRWRPRSGGRR